MIYCRGCACEISDDELLYGEDGQIVYPRIHNIPIKHYVLSGYPVDADSATTKLAILRPNNTKARIIVPDTEPATTSRFEMKQLGQTAFGKGVGFNER